LYFSITDPLQRENFMDALKILAIILIVGGGLGLVYGGFSYTKETHTADIGPLQLSVKDKQRVNIPLWAGLGALIGGGVLLVVPRKG
jgi:TRAP-type C4-dicarboxylate transport system permease small subunit